TVATTRPETMFGDTAVAVHADDDRYKDLIGKNVILPIVNRAIPIVADEHADPEKGTGAVKITPAHDFNDFEVGKRHNLEMISVLDIDAKMNENTPKEYQGLDRFEARKKVLAEMEELELVDKIEKYENTIPYGDRSGVVIEPRLTDQWYCDAETLAKPALKAVEDGRTEIMPSSMKKTYYQWMNNIQPWCISRQIWWGHQIPAWFGPEGSVFVEETEEEAYVAAKKKFGDDVKLERDSDVLDTWFSSALWPFSTLGWPEKTKELDRYYPAEMMISGTDLIFFWIARMMMMGMHFMGDVPFKKVYMHALVLDEKGQKMSKSKGNVIDPLDLIEQYGTDSLRFTLTILAAQGKNVRLSAGRVEGYRNFGTKLWNAARFCEMNECILTKDFKPENNKHRVNKWIASELATVTKKTEEALDAYKFNEAATVLYQFAWGTLCDWYIELTKPLLGGADEDVKKEVRETAGWVLDQTLLLLNPIMPYVTEELHANLLGLDKVSENKEDWLMTKSWPVFADNITDVDSQDEINWVLDVITSIRSVRADMNVPASAKIKMLLKGANEQNQKRLADYNEIICRLARLEIAEITEDDPQKGSIQTVVAEANIILPMADVIDIDQERERLKKEIEKVSKNIDKINKMLSNPGFIKKAPEDVISEQKETMRLAENIREKLNQALKQIEAA
ncbi:MAG: valine--tRNA ligase, partial [Flavobacteriaceae bacterium]|nr:valine--tRNA ligase [Flavobacteriaceae bacterium]